MRNKEGVSQHCTHAAIKEGDVLKLRSSQESVVAPTLQLAGQHSS
jgi:hypothetical protein